MIVSKVTYTGKLHTEAVHLASGSRIQTDAPVDNHGKGKPSPYRSVVFVTGLLHVHHDGYCGRTP